MWSGLAFSVASGLALVACSPPTADTTDPINTAQPQAVEPTVDEVLNMSAAELTARGDKQAGKAAWDSDCNQAFLGDLAAARRVKSALFSLPYAQHSERSDFCKTLVETMLADPGHFRKKP